MKCYGWQIFAEQTLIEEDVKLMLEGLRLCLQEMREDDIK